MKNFEKHLIKKGSKVKEALAQLSDLSPDVILFVVDDNKKLIGSLTDGDIRKGLIQGFNIENSIDEIIYSKPIFIRKGEHKIEKLIEYREKLYRIIPVLALDNKIVDVINFRNIKSYLPVDAIIMAGGKGKRLLPLTADTPKPLLKVGEKPIIEHNIDRLSLFGVNNIWISINYLGDKIEQYLGNGLSKNINISYVREKTPLGTIGAVSQINNLKHEYIIILNSDLLTNFNYENFFSYFIKQSADMVVATMPYKVNIPYAVLETDNEKVINFKEKPTYTYHSNAGIYLIKKSVLNYLPKNQFYNATDLLDKMVSLNKKVFSYPLMEYWLDIGSPSDFQKAQQDIKKIDLK
jgi:dTDP-glucose pyrophosphorylase